MRSDYGWPQVVRFFFLMLKFDFVASTAFSSSLCTVSHPIMTLSQMRHSGRQNASTFPSTCIDFWLHLMACFNGFFDLKWKLDVGLVRCRSSTAISKLLIGDILGTWWFLSSDVLKFPLSWRVCNFVLKFPLSWVVVTFPLSWRLPSVVLEFPLSWGVCSVVLEFPLSWGVFEFHLCFGVCKN